MFNFEAELEKLDVQENDTFILRTKERLTSDACQKLRRELDKFLTQRGFKNVRVLILESGLVLEKL